MIFPANKYKYFISLCRTVLIILIRYLSGINRVTQKSGGRYPKDKDVFIY